METTLTDAPPVVEKQLNSFERYLTVWVALCMVAGVVLGQAAPGLVHTFIALFGAESGAALATVVGVLVEVPVMLSVCGICNRTRHWFTREAVVRSRESYSSAPATRLGVKWRKVGCDIWRAIAMTCAVRARNQSA